LIGGDDPPASGIDPFVGLLDTDEVAAQVY